MELKKVELSDRDLMNQYLNLKQDKCCDMSFADIYLWSRKYKVGYTFLEGCLVFGDPGEDFSYAFPFGTDENRKKAVEALEAEAKAEQKPFRLHLVTPSDFEKLNSWFPGRYKIAYDRDMADYVYETEKLASLSGKKYHGKKNHVNKFKKLYPDWSYEAITDNNVEECFQMALKWRHINECDLDDEKRDEMCVTLNALRLMNELKLTGGLIRADGEVVAFCIGEELNPDMYVVHIEKAFPDVPGAYPMINQQFVLHEAMNYPYVNREEDTGAEGLRRAKESYHPVFLMEKGVVTLA
ncbi:Uncharacterized conserved protein [uncultured Roseburia sp.]|uniref:Phosphatidylglycerol lysyltransferase domain-containing protein n=1 Tax=Brotonthovivens ammoniilytica TaxID=2981725 RepID=A0ABT2TFG8_9FIRM|nr:phosphatidylglycerol lysyltransferase domain-containing protein [Brotonthovivens ammoniilytica]MCU6760938.1 phosphatidylglycerol lysyltransferase domain-containing protein [Brotonthovivens ammoniilytica]SCI13982.1 Uncharacterized conserved protein [uncultured Roseburia sp.]